MTIEESLRNRIGDLINSAQRLKRTSEHGQAISEDQEYDCRAWLAAAANAVFLVCPNDKDAYRVQFERVLDRSYRFLSQEAVGTGSAILKSLLRDIEEGLLSSIADKARAETFDNFLDHAKAYHKKGMAREAGVIAGVVFEDSIRRVCEINDISQRGLRLDTLISDLAKASIITQTKAKRARVAAHVRTKATHAQWDEFDLNDVSDAIAVAEDLILNCIES